MTSGTRSTTSATSSAPCSTSCPASTTSARSISTASGAEAAEDRPRRSFKRELRSRSEAEGELRVLAHPVRRPRRREDHARLHALDAIELADELLDLLGDLRADRAARRGEREGHVHVARVDLDPVDEAELDEVQPELGIDDVGERRFDVFDGDHDPQGTRVQRPPLRRSSLQGIVDFEPQPGVLRCRGDEDRATQSLRRQAFSRALTCARDVVVDLSELSFADSSLMLDLAALSRRLRQAGGTLRLRSPQPQIKRLIELVGLDRLPGVVLEPESLAY